MGNKGMHMETKRVLLFVALLGLLLSCIVGTTYARYQKQVTKDMDFVIKKPANLTVTEGEGWIASATEGLFYTFTVGNGGEAEDAYFGIRLLGSLGMRLDGLTVVIEEAGGSERFLATATAIDPADPIYLEMGEGVTYRFLDEEGREISWKLLGGTEDVRTLRLTVTGDVTEPNLMQIVVFESREIQK